MKAPVRHGLEEDGGGGNSFGIGHESVGQMTSMRQIQTHHAIMWIEKA